MPCLKDYTQTTADQAARPLLRTTYRGAANETAAAILAKVGQACGINPRVLLVLLQKEQGLVTGTKPDQQPYYRRRPASPARTPRPATRLLRLLQPGLPRRAAVQAVRRRARPATLPGRQTTPSCTTRTRLRQLAGLHREPGHRRAVQLHALPAERGGAGRRLRQRRRLLLLRQPQLLELLHRLVRLHPVRPAAAPSREVPAPTAAPPAAWAARRRLPLRPRDGGCFQQYEHGAASTGRRSPAPTSSPARCYRERGPRWAARRSRWATRRRPVCGLTAVRLLPALRRGHRIYSSPADRYPDRGRGAI